MAKRQSEKIFIHSILANAFADVTDLAEEMRSWYDNMPEGLQGGSKGEEVDECANALESIQEIELPEWLNDSKLEESKQAFVELWPLKRNASRATRCAYIVECLSSLKSHVEDKYLPESPKKDEAQELLDQIETMIDDLEAVEFPGMYG